MLHRGVGSLKKFPSRLLVQLYSLLAPLTGTYSELKSQEQTDIIL